MKNLIKTQMKNQSNYNNNRQIILCRYRLLLKSKDNEANIKGTSGCVDRNHLSLAKVWSTRIVNCIVSKTFQSFFVSLWESQFANKHKSKDGFCNFNSWRFAPNVVDVKFFKFFKIFLSFWNRLILKLPQVADA